MSNTRNDVVTKFVRPSVPFFLLVSFEFYLVLKSFNGVLGVFEVSRVFQGSFKDVSRTFPGCFNED